MSVPRPNLVVVGAMRSGTTSLHALLGAHPEIFMSAIKGPGLFLDPGEPIVYPSKYGSTAEKRRFLEDDALLDAMARGFRGEPVFGESTDLYARYPVSGRGAPEKMLRWSPEMRVVYLVRDPLERVLSQHRFERAKPHRPAPASLAAYLRSPGDPIGAGRYHAQLQRFLRLGFRPQQIHVVALEELLRSPSETLATLAKFLEVAPWPARRAPSLPRLNGSSAVWQPRFDATAAKRLVRALEPDVRALEDWLGRSLPFASFEAAALQHTAA